MNRSKSNKELLILLKKGDIKAFDAIYHRYSYRLFRFALKYLREEADAEEIVQEVFVKIWEKRKFIDTAYSFNSFLFTIAYNSTISLVRKKIREKEHLLRMSIRQPAECSVDIIDELNYRELSSQIQSLLNELSPRQREIYKLSREKGLTLEEIASQLNLSVHTVKNHLVLALSFLRSHLDRSIMVNMLFISLFL
ncbi:MAG: RNA polymerase sigma-70 factor [Mangrovibacterium sp.]